MSPGTSQIVSAVGQTIVFCGLPNGGTDFSLSWPAESRLRPRLAAPQEMANLQGQTKEVLAKLGNPTAPSRAQRAPRLSKCFCCQAAFLSRGTLWVRKQAVLPNFASTS